MKERATAYEKEAAVLLEAASLALKREYPDYGEAERMMSRVHICIRYARECNNGTFKGESF